MTAMTVTTTQVSADEFLAGDYPIGSELIGGVVYVNDATFPHNRLCKRIDLALTRWTDGPGSGESGQGGNWVLSDGHVYRPDVWWAAVPPEGALHEGPPDLAIEVRSPKTWHLDIGHKRDEYRAPGTKELWLVDTPARTIIVYRGRSLDDTLEIGPDEQLTSSLLPGFTLAIDELFAQP